jgi:NAD(P)-dependent dehydrogenase (short-subunit alcohol dehydrogenase family)
VTGPLHGRVCVVAGIGGVIGNAVASRYSDDGGSVVGIDRDEVDGPFETIRADLCNDTETSVTLRDISERYGSIDVLYVNAGPADREDHAVMETPHEVWERVFRAVLMPAELCARHGVPLMTSPGGSLVFTGSFLAEMGASTAQMAFSAAKAAVNQLGRDLGTHLARSGIRVNVIGLGPVHTPESKAMFDRLGPEESQRRFLHIPMGRFATPQEVAAGAAYLASNDSGYTTAAVFPIHGGIPGAYTIPQAPD